MSDFVNELKSKISACGNYEDLVGDGENWTCTNQRLIDDALALINSLGENARKMLEIGRLQDELVKMGFKELLISHYINEDKDIAVYFFKKHAYIGGNDVYDYTSPTWQQDVINKVKELLNDK